MKLKFYMLAVCAIALTIDLHAQCSNDIALSSQADVDSYQSVYGCSAITGSLTISGSDITDLTGLSGVTSVGTLFVSNNPNLESLHGLENLTTIGASCSCTAYGLTISDNPRLPNIDGLSGITSIGGMVNIKSNVVLTNVNGLSRLGHIGTNKTFGDQSFIIQSNPMLTSLAPFAGVSGSVGGIDIIDNDALTDLQGLHNINKIQGGGLEITGNASLTSISALSKVSTVNVSVEVSNNAVLPNLNGFRSLYGIEIASGSGVNIAVSNNPSLSDIDSLSNFQSFEAPMRHVTFTNNPKLTRGCGLFTLVSQKESSCPGCVIYNFSGSGITKDQILAGGPCKPTADCGSLSFTSQADVNAFPTTYGCSVIRGSLTISGNDISDLSPLSGITTISGVITIKDNPVLTNTNGLSHLTTLGDGVDYAVQSIIIENNPMLTSLAGFSNVRGTVGEVHVDNNDALTDLQGLQNLTAIAGYGLSLTGNDALTSISALSKVTIISGAVRIMNNRQLPNLNGLRSLSQVAIVRGGGVAMVVTSNPALTNVDSLSSFVELRGPSMTVDFSNNPSLRRGCGLYPLLNDYVQNCSSCVVTYNFSGSGITKEGILAGGPCPAESASCNSNIALASQADVDSFPSRHGCTIINGSLFIRGADITNLDSLIYIKSVDMLFIDGNPVLENIDGLHQITTISGRLTGTPYAGLRINNNPALTNIDGLSSLTSVGQELVITNNAALQNIEGLASLTSVGANPQIHYLGLDLENNPALATIAGLRNLTSIEGYVNIINNDALVDFDGLQKIEQINRIGLAIMDNQSLKNVNGLSSLKRIYGTYSSGLRISNNASLTNVDSLSNLVDMGYPPRYLTITDNPNLTRGCGLYNIIRIQFCDGCNGTLTLSNNGAGITRDEIIAGGPCDGNDTVSPTMPTNLMFTDVTDNSMTVSFTPGVRAKGYLMLMRAFESSLPDEGPENNIFYNVGDVVGCCSIVVGAGMDTTHYIVYLEPDVDYYFDIIPWIQVDMGITYFPDLALSGHQRTMPQAQPYPNPFMEELVIPVSVTEANTTVKISITDQMGRLVSEITKTLDNAGKHEISWNRVDLFGNRVVNGVYTYSIITPNNSLKGLVMAK